MQHDNTVELVNYTGSDLLHGKAAWVSTGGVSEEKLARLPELLKTMADNGHGTPYEHSQFTFLVTSEIASHIQSIRHRAGISFNVESARYREIKDDRVYVPADWPRHIQEDYLFRCNKMMEYYHDLIVALQRNGISRTRAKESARFIRPYGAQISYYVTFNFRSLMYFISLRRDEHAQLEIREIADKMLNLVRDIPGSPFQHSLAAYGFA